jgi:hypothetical protein
MIAHAALAFVGAALVAGRADNENKLIVANRTFHERRELIARSDMPLIKHDIDAVPSQPRREITNPGLVRIIVPRI